MFIQYVQHLRKQNENDDNQETEGKITSIENYQQNKSANLPTMLNCSQPRGVTWPQTPDCFFLRVQRCGIGTKWTISSEVPLTRYIAVREIGDRHRERNLEKTNKKQNHSLCYMQLFLAFHP